MRLRNIPGSREKIAESEFCVDNPVQYRGKWHELFGNDNPIHMEIGMGKGRFIRQMAQAHPDINYIGIEMYSSVLVRAVEAAEADETNGKVPANFRFIRFDAKELCDIFEKGEVQKLYLNFSDPWPKERHAKRRLTSKEFLKRYEQVLPDGAVVEFKTDNSDLFEFSLEQAKEAGWKITACTNDLHADEELNKGNIMTEYEERFSSKGQKINKMIIMNPDK